MRAILDEATDPWGIKVNRVELKNILPPQDIQNSMEKQMKAERDRRQAILQAEGTKRSQILVAEGEKEAAILKADAEKQAAILKAEAEKQAAILKADGEAQAIMAVQKAMADSLALLNEKYGITEDDFTSAELEAVPAVKATDIGLDRSMIGAYGHDDRVCAYAALRALLDLEGTPAKTAVCVLADKEEIGSDGVTGMQSAAFDTFMEDLCESQGAAVRVCFEKSFCLSADVTAAYDPNFSDVYEKRNAAYLNYGIGLCKYTGARGKSGASDADAETVAYIRNLFDEAGVIWQIAELGKVDAGGGGTVAMYMANRNITTLDAGVPVLSMHAPFETVSKLDCYETYKGMKAVFQAEK